MIISNDSFEVEMAVKQRKNDVLIKMIVKNIGKEVAVFCKYHTPFEGIQNNIFDVWKGQTEIPYVGMLKKRIPPSEKDYVKLAPNKEVSCEVALDGYDMTQKGRYKLQFSGNLISGLPESNVVEFEIY